jgi:hypothetical protein
MLSLTPLIAAALAAAPAVVAPAAAPAPTARPASAEAALALEAGEGRAVAAKLADALLANFVIPAQATRYAAMLRANAASGRYDAGTRGSLANLMSDDLMAVHKDGHLKVQLAPTGDERGGRSGIPKDWPPLIQAAKWIAPGIAYIRFTAFLSTDEEVAAVRAFMATHAEAKAIIFDLRNHHGGRLGEMDEIFPYLFKAKTPLVKMEVARSIFDAHGSPFGEGATLEVAKADRQVTTTHWAIPGRATPLREAKIILLTSNATGSAAEHFSLAMKSSGRATLIGEATAGANHFGGPAPLNDHFAVWMPIGRTYDIKTGADWEGAGVAPDVAVDPKLALVVALEKLGLSHAEAVRLDAGEVPAAPVHRDKLRAR